MPTALTRSMLPVASIVVAGLAAAGCSSGRLDQVTSDQAESDLVVHLAAAGLTVDDATNECAVRRFDARTADALRANELRGSDADVVAEAVVDCVRGVSGLGQLLSPLADARPESLDCAIGKLDEEVVGHLLASALSGDDGSRSADELEVTAALSLCLTPEELLEFHS